jgi:hypothetical protein
MMDSKEASLLLGVHKELEDAMAMKVKISHEQVIYITATDLLKKYQALLARPKADERDAEAFKRVLVGWYFTEEELAECLK